MVIKVLNWWKLYYLIRIKKTEANKQSHSFISTYFQHICKREIFTDEKLNSKIKRTFKDTEIILFWDHF